MFAPPRLFLLYFCPLSLSVGTQCRLGYCVLLWLILVLDARKAKRI